eukprot:13282872-Alexandrium_andersonii.AAC.1
MPRTESWGCRFPGSSGLGQGYVLLCLRARAAAFGPQPSAAEVWASAQALRAQLIETIGGCKPNAQKHTIALSPRPAF